MKNSIKVIFGKLKPSQFDSLCAICLQKSAVKPFSKNEEQRA